MFTVRQVLAKEIIIISPSSTIRVAAEILLKYRFHVLSVCEGEKY
jgi:CBS domain-containing membrane protein